VATYWLKDWGSEVGRSHGRAMKTDFKLYYYYTIPVYCYYFNNRPS